MVLTATMLSSAMWAINSLNVHSKTGDVATYLFSDQPVVTYDADNLVLTTNKVTVEYPIADLERITFSETEDSAIDQVMMNSSSSTDGNVVVYSLNGNVVCSFAAVDGMAQLKIDDLKPGAYVIRNGNITYKIIKK